MTTPKQLFFSLASNEVTLHENRFLNELKLSWVTSSTKAHIAFAHMFDEWHTHYPSHLTFTTSAFLLSKRKSWWITRFTLFRLRCIFLIMPSSISCISCLLGPPFGSYFDESNFLLLIWGACSSGYWTLCCGPWRGISLRLWEAVEWIWLSRSSLHWSFDCFLCCFSTNGTYSE